MPESRHTRPASPNRKEGIFKTRAKVEPLNTHEVGQDTAAGSSNGFFVVLSGDGTYWTGDGWTSRRKEAKRFDDPLPDPWLTCRAACNELGLRLSVYCVPLYVPPSAGA